MQLKFALCTMRHGRWWPAAAAAPRRPRACARADFFSYKKITIGEIISFMPFFNRPSIIFPCGACAFSHMADLAHALVLTLVVCARALTADLGRVRCRADFFWTKRKSVRDHIVHAEFLLFFIRITLISCVRFDDLFPVFSWLKRRVNTWCWINVRLASQESMITSKPRGWSPALPARQVKGIVQNYRLACFFLDNNTFAH